jgi:glucose-1-phosphate thymidylyltransferase
MSNQKLKVVIPMAGYGKRLRPHTWSKPKPLVSTAGKATLGHVLDIVATVKPLDQVEISFIVGYLGDQVKEYMQKHYPEIEAHFFEQVEMKGQSHAIALAKEKMVGPTLVVFVDTIIDTDLSFLNEEAADAVIWVKEVDDPRRFGIVVVNDEGHVANMVEKPDSMENNLAIVGYYYFREGKDLVAAIDTQIEKDILTKGEYFLADAMAIMIKNGLKMRPQTVDSWLDTGIPATVLEANKHLLSNGRNNSHEGTKIENSKIISPVFIHPTAIINSSTVGPYVSIGENCVINNSTVSETVLESGVVLENTKIINSILGNEVIVKNYEGQINLGDNSSIQGLK